MKNIQTFIIGLFAILFFGTGAANAATWAVTKGADGNDGVCNAADCSLREAVAAANSGDTIVVLSTFGGEINLGGSEIVVSKSITIDGSVYNTRRAGISGDYQSRIFHIQSGVNLTLKNMTLSHGNGKMFVNDPDNSNGGAIFGAFNNNLSLDRVGIYNNKAKYGGALYLVNGTHHFTNSSITDNSAEVGDTAIAAINATLYISNTTVSGNYIYPNNGQAIGPGAIALVGSNLIMRNSTVAENSAARGGGIYAVKGATATTIDIGNSIVAGNTATDLGQDFFYGNVDVTMISRGGNLIQNLETVPGGIFTAQSDVMGINPLLAPRGNEFATFTTMHALQAGSPARNGGLNQNAVDPFNNQPLTIDGRGAGFPRITDTTVDIGAFEDQSGNTSLIVSKKTNSNDLVCDTDCSLREAVHQASLTFGTQTITFAPNSQGDFALGGSEIVIQNQNVNIVGYPVFVANHLTISGGDTNRIFRLNNATVKFSGLSLADGDAGAGFGGAVLAENNSNLTLDNVIVNDNFAAAYGALHLNGGTHRIVNSAIVNNSANTGLAMSVGGTLNMANTTVSGNRDADGGTGIGAIYVTGTANIRNSTIAFNRTPGGTGGGIFSSGTLNIGNSIVSNNNAGTSPDVHRSSGVITSVGGNLVQNTSGFPMGTFAQTNDQTGVDPLLGALMDVGFPSYNENVPTHPLMPNSPALDSGINANAVDPFDNSVLATDARGEEYLRIQNTTVDKGAFEALIPLAATVNVGGRVSVGGSGLRNAIVVLTDMQGVSRTVKTSSFGYFKFEEVEVGATYTVSVMSKRFQFAPQIVSVTEEITELNFTAE